MRAVNPPADKVVDLFTLAVKTAVGPSSASPATPPSVPSFSAPSLPTPSFTPGNASAAVDSAVSGAIDLIKVILAFRECSRLSPVVCRFLINIPPARTFC